MIRPGKILIAGAIVAAVLAILFYLLPQREDEDIDQTANIPGQPIISWQKIKITEERKNVLIDITVPRIIIGSSYNLDSEINKAITWRVDLLKSEFISGVTTAAYDNGETNILNIETVWSDLERVGATNIPADTLDGALLINIMFQSRNNRAILDEARRLLKVGGKLLVVDWKVEPTPFGPPLSDRLSPEKVKEFAGSLGLKEAKQFDAGPYHYGFVLIKQ